MRLRDREGLDQEGLLGWVFFYIKKVTFVCYLKNAPTFQICIKLKMKVSLLRGNSWEDNRLVNNRLDLLSEYIFIYMNLYTSFKN